MFYKKKYCLVNLTYNTTDTFIDYTFLGNLEETLVKIWSIKVEVTQATLVGDCIGCFKHRTKIGNKF